MLDRMCDRRRGLEFGGLAEVISDVRCLQDGHRTVGRWTLAQICKHLAGGINGSIDGLDLSRHRLKRFFFSRTFLRYTFRFGIPADYLVDPGIEPTIDPDPDEAISDLSRAIDRYLSHRGPLRAHPLFGRMRREVWDRVHRVHCAHHLSFVIPEQR